MLRRTRHIALVAGVVAACLALPVTADAAKRKVPFGFFGSVVPPLMMSPTLVSDAKLDAQMKLMAQSGVESVRVSRAWSDVEPAQGRYTLDKLDRLIGALARHGLRSIINVTTTPKWAAANQNNHDYYRLPPKSNSLFADMWSQLVLRYGNNGTYWRENPTVPKLPVRQWQVWNEPSGPGHWKPRPWAPSYVRLLKASSQAIHAADRRAQVVSGPLVATGAYTQWQGVSDLLKAGARKYLDVMSVHPFTNDSTSARKSAQRVLDIVKLVRQRMNKRGARRMPIILTEMTWPASVGRTPKGATLHFSVTPRQQAARLKAVYGALAKARRKLRVTGAYWYTWSSSYDKTGPLSVMTFNFSGLTRFKGGAFKAQPILRVYRNTAASYQGCRKSADARRCR